MRDVGVVLISLAALGCSDPVCCDPLVPLSVAGVVTLEGQPIVAEVGLWDSHWSDTGADDSAVALTQSGHDGRYAISVEVHASACATFGSQYYLRVLIDGVVDAQTSERRFVGATEILRCEQGQLLDFALELPPGTVWTGP